MARQNPPDTPKGPDPSPFLYADYIETKKTLTAALKGPCFYALVTGASGMGKTELGRDITASLDSHRFQIVYLTSANISLVSVVRFLAQRLHVGARRSYLETVDVIAETISAQSSHMVLWLDEADRLETDTLSEIRTLAEHKLLSRQIVTIVLCGLPTLQSKLEAPTLFPLKRRISHRLALTGLRRDELDAFVAHRFGCTQAQRIPTSARDELFERTQAAPALIDQVCRHALAKANHNHPLDPELIRAVLDTHGL